ncbi:MAG: hypothetical protein WBC06_05940 [Chitinophagaceae bacterium]
MYSTKSTVVIILSLLFISRLPVKAQNVGIGTTTPQTKLHFVSTVGANSGTDQSVLIENTNTSTGEAALGFRNAGIAGTGAKAWFTGLNQTRNFSWVYGNSFLTTDTKMLLDSTGRLGIGTTTPNASAALEISSTTAGVLIPRMSTAQRTAITAPANGLLVYDSETNSYWFSESATWIELSGSMGLKSINGSSTFTTFNMNPKRFIWEINASIPQGSSIPIPQAIVDDLCADDDGCKVTITMTNWAAGMTQSASVSTSLFYTNAAGGRKWRTSNDLEGTDGDNGVQHVLTLFNTFYFTDAVYTGSIGSDAVVGLNFMRWNNYPVTTIGRLILED